MFDETYKEMLCLLCRQAAIVEQYQLLLQEGQVLDEEVFAYHLKTMAFAKEELLKKKAELGYEDGLLFMEDASFMGFTYKDGCLTGDCSNLPKIALSFMDKEEEDDHFLYEVGVLLLSHYFMQLGQYEYKKNQLLKPVPLGLRIKRALRIKVKTLKDAIMRFRGVRKEVLQ